jgi:hypothetical protein
MSTELFRRYINIINEVSENEMTELTRAITDLETVLAKYKNKIRENQNNRAQTRLLEIDLSQMSRAEIEALRQSGSRSQAELDAARAGGTTGPMFGPDNPPGPGMGSKLKALGRKGATIAGVLALGAEILSQVYDYMMKTDLKDLAPGDQEIIKKNIPIIQSWLAPNKFEILNRYGSLQTRLLHVVDLLGKLGLSLKSEPAAATPGAVPAADSQSLEKLLNKAQPFNEYYQAELKKIIAENMHLFSEAEKIAVHRDLVSEDLSDIPGYQYALGTAGLGTTGGALAWAQAQANKLAAEKIAAEKAAEQASADALAAKEKNARITAQNTEAMRKWKIHNGRQIRAGGKPLDLPELTDLVQVPTVPSAYPPSKLTRLQRMGARVSPGKLLEPLAKKHPIKAAIGGTVLGGLYWMYDLVAPLAKQAIGVKTGLETMQAGLDAISKNSPKEDYYALFKYLTDNPTAYTNADPATKKALDQKQLDFCNNFPREPDCEQRKKDICQDYEVTGPDGKVTSLPGCDLG